VRDYAIGIDKLPIAPKRHSPQKEALVKFKDGRGHSRDTEPEYFDDRKQWQRNNAKAALQLDAQRAAEVRRMDVRTALKGRRRLLAVDPYAPGAGEGVQVTTAELERIAQERWQARVSEERWQARVSEERWQARVSEERWQARVSEERWQARVSEEGPAALCRGVPSQAAPSVALVLSLAPSTASPSTAAWGDIGAVTSSQRGAFAGSECVSCRSPTPPPPTIIVGGWYIDGEGGDATSIIAGRS
jgi:hypothetical protein